MNWLKAGAGRGRQYPAILIYMDAGDVGTAATAAGHRAGTGDAAGGCVSPPEPVQQQAVEENDPADAAAGAAGCSGSTGTEARTEPGEAGTSEGSSHGEACSSEAQGGAPPRRPEAIDALPAPRTSAPPRAQREAPLASAVNAGSVASMIATYNQRVARTSCGSTSIRRAPTDKMGW